MLIVKFTYITFYNSNYNIVSLKNLHFFVEHVRISMLKLYILISPCMVERITINMKAYTKCVFISPSYVIFVITVRKGTEIIAEGNVVFDTALDGHYEYHPYDTCEDKAKKLFMQALHRCQIRAQKIFNKN